MGESRDLCGWPNPETRDFGHWLNCLKGNRGFAKMVAFMITGGCEPIVIKRCFAENIRAGQLRDIKVYLGEDLSWVDRVDWSAICAEIKDLYSGKPFMEGR